MMQIEMAAEEHPRKEAGRLSGEPPAFAMLAVSEHAERTIGELQRLAGNRVGSIGRTIGEAFTPIRDAVSGRLISAEKSYRGTLLGLHHGVDCATLTRAVASECGDFEVANLLSSWLQERQLLVYECEDQLKWFARHPRRATERAA